MSVLVTAAALCAAAPAGAATHKSAHHKKPGPASYYVLASAKARCKRSYTKQTVTLRVRKHHRWVKTHQTRCVYTGSGASFGATPTFPANLPTAGVTVNVLPTAVADSYSTPAGQELAVSAPGVLANDEGFGLVAELVSGPAHGTLTLSRNGSFHYVPDAGYSGVDHFSYRDGDSSGDSSSPVSVALHVTPVAAAVGPFQANGSGDAQAGAPGVLTGAVGNGLTASLVSPPSHGQITLNADGSFSYSADAGFAGSDSFQFEALDAAGQASNVITVSIDVNAGPPTVVPQTFSGAVANTELQVGGTRGQGPEVYRGTASLLSGDIDPNGGTLTTTPETITNADGTVTVNGDGTFTYQPTVDFAGPYSFNYQVDTSEGMSAPATATIDFGGARVWYVQASAAPGGDGGSAHPFQTLALATAVATSGDVIELATGSYSNGVTLGASETLVGESVGLVSGSDTIVEPSGANPVIGNAGGAGVTLSTSDELSGVTVSGTSGDGISATGAGTFTVTSSVIVSGSGANGLEVSGGTGDASVAASITGSAAHSVYVHGRLGGTLSLTGPITDDADGVLLSSNTGATIAFTHPITASTTNANPAFAALGGGTVTATASGSTLTATSAIALDVENTTIGSTGLTFQAINAGGSSSGPAEGIMLVQTGTAGGLTVTGFHNQANSGGEIQSTTGGAAISLSNTGPVGLADVELLNNTGDDISANDVSSLSVFESTLTGGARGIAATSDVSTPQLFDIEDNVISGQQGAALSLLYAGSTEGNILNNFIGSESPVLAGSVSGDGIDLWPTAGGTMTANVAQNEIVQVDTGVGIHAQAPGAGTLALTLTDNTISMDKSGSHNGVTVGSTGSVCLNPIGNTVTAAGSSANGLEVDLLTGSSVFQIQGLSGDPATFLESGNTLAGGSGGAAALAVPNGLATFTAPSQACATAPPGGGIGSI